MVYSHDGEPRVEGWTCPECDDTHQRSTGFVLDDGSAFAVYFADWYPHTEEAFVDVILGGWGDADYSENVTFGCRLGRVEEAVGPAASLVKGGEMRAEDPIFGHKLDRPGALEHPWLATFWDLVDWLVVNDRLLHDHVYHMDEDA